MAAFGFQKGLGLLNIKEIHQVKFLPVKFDFTGCSSNINNIILSFVPACEAFQPLHATWWRCPYSSGQKEKWHFKSALEPSLQKSA